MCVGPNSSDVQGDLVVKFPSNEGSEDTVMVNSKKKEEKNQNGQKIWYCIFNIISMLM